MIAVNQFIDIWQKSNSPAEVAEKTGLTMKAIYRRVARYRKKGVQLKYFRLGDDVAQAIERAGRYD